MQFFILLFINIILWAAFYLVISLKLERSASEFREKRLRREVDAIIREFNETAERNISLLENRIAIAKRLMAQSGTLQQLDLSADADLGQEMKAGFDQGTRSKRGAGFDIDTPEAAQSKPAFPQQPPQLGDYLTMLKSFVRDRAASLGARIMGETARSGDPRGSTPAPDAVRDVKANAGLVHTTGGNRLIKKEYADIEAMAVEKSGDDAGIDEAEIAEMFKTSKDKYSLVADLYGKGCRVELLSRCSGISLGEIRLVLNLNKPVQ